MTGFRHAVRLETVNGRLGNIWLFIVRSDHHCSSVPRCRWLTARWHQMAGETPWQRSDRTERLNEIALRAHNFIQIIWIKKTGLRFSECPVDELHRSSPLRAAWCRDMSEINPVSPKPTNRKWRDQPVGLSWLLLSRHKPSESDRIHPIGERNTLIPLSGNRTRGIWREWFHNNWNSSNCWRAVQHSALAIAVASTTGTLEMNSQVQLVEQW
jgi:hypothetical protein